MSLFSREMTSFVEIARARSLRQAAQQLNVSASALSRQISILEEELGVQLMIRLPGGMRLTPKGLELLRQADRWFDETAQLRLGLRSSRAAETLTFRLGIMECLGSTLMPRLWQRLESAGALVDCSVTVGHTAALFAQMLAGEQDVIVAFNIPRQKDIRVLQEWAYPIGLVCPPAWLGRPMRSIALRDCLSWPLLLPASPLSSHPRLHAEILRQRHDMTISLQTNSVDVLRRMVAAAKGVTFLTRPDVMAEVERGELRFVALSDRRLTERLALCTLGGTAHTPAMEALLRCVRDELTRLSEWSLRG